MGSRYVIFIQTTLTLCSCGSHPTLSDMFSMYCTLALVLQVRLLTHFLPHSCSPSIAFLQTGFCETFNFLLKLKACIGYQWLQPPRYSLCSGPAWDYSKQVAGAGEQNFDKVSEKLKFSKYSSNFLLHYELQIFL